MPSRDSTGKRLSGAKQRAKAAAKKPPGASSGAPGGACGDGGSDAADPAPLPVDPPPRGAPVAEAIVWLAHVQALAATLAGAGGEPARVRAISVISTAASKLRVAALDSESAVNLAASYLGTTIPYDTIEPPQERAALSLWAFWRLVELAYATATQAEAVDEGQVSHQARALATCGAVQPQAAIDRYLAAARDAAATALRVAG